MEKSNHPKTMTVHTNARSKGVKAVPTNRAPRSGLVVRPRVGGPAKPVVAKTAGLQLDMGSVPATYSVSIKKLGIYNGELWIDYGSEDRIEELLAEYCSTATEGPSKPPGKDGKTRYYFKCVMYRQDDCSAKWSLNYHQFREGCKAIQGKTTYPYLDMGIGQGKLVKCFRKTRRSISLRCL